MKNAVSIVLVSLLVVSLASACKSKETQQQGAGETTETIAPAAAKPLPTGNEAMTQTVDVEGGRSEAEGGGITSPEPPVATIGTAPTTTAAVTTAPATGAAAVAKGKSAPPVSRNRTQ